ncbi:MAG: Fe-S cluster assembly protein SufD [Chlamydiae bacterium]|nr:Fe-S cluster assembly protein SufD [Chlamydiota bacterium]MBI3266204.1 Fe-S cluster assembly protein SufD [Chlamydiota bacterium]
MSAGFVSKMDSFVSAFEFLQRQKEGSFLRALRQKAFDQFSPLGFPTQEREEWKYTDVSQVVNTPYEISFHPPSLPLSPGPLFLEDLPADRLVFVNGFYTESLSRKSQGLQIKSLREAVHEKSFQKYFDQERKEKPLDALNTALFQEGLFLEIPKGAKIQHPIHFLFIYSCQRPEAIFPRNLFVLNEHSEATVVESHVGLDGEVYFSSPLTEMVLKEGARLELIQIQKQGGKAFHIGSSYVNQERNSFFSHAVATLSGKLVRNDLNMTLRGEGSECVSNGLYWTEEGQHVDNTTFVDHAFPQGTSRQLYKGVLSGRSTAVFYGKILVRHGAQKTDAQQTNQNLLLSKDAKVDTRPQLEILADDVKCTHGAAVGQLEEEPLFYLKTRGLGEAAARRLLTYGFMHEVTDQIRLEPVRQRVEEVLLGRLL